MTVNVRANSISRDLLLVLDNIVKESKAGEDTKGPLLQVRPVVLVAPKSEANVLFSLPMVCIGPKC